MTPKPRRTPEALAADFKAKARAYDRKAWIEAHPEIKRALALAEQCTKLSAALTDPALSDALHDAAHDIDEKCEHAIQAGLSASARGSENTQP